MSSELQAAVAELRFDNCLTVTLVTAVVYDYIITLLKEIHYIWNRPWTFVSFTFIIVRYVGLAVAIADGLYGSTFVPGPTEASTALIIACGWGFIAFLAAADIVMILRVYAMYHRSRMVLGVLAVFCAATILTYAVSFSYYHNPHTHLTMTTLQVLHMSFCYETNSGSLQLGEYKRVPRLALAALMFVLVVFRLYMESFQMYKATKRWKVNQSLDLLVKEGVLYFFVHILNNVDFGSSKVGGFLTILILILLYILSPRFVMNVRELHLRKVLRGSGWDNGIDTGFGVWDGRSSQVQSMSSIGFADLRAPEMIGEMEMRGLGDTKHEE